MPDQGKHVVGPLCRNNHRHKGAARSLRYASTRQCIRCLRAWQKVWVSSNRERQNFLARKSYWKNRAKCLSRMRGYRRTPAFRASALRSRTKNKNKLLANTRAWRLTPRGRACVAINNFNRREAVKCSGPRDYTAADLEKRMLSFGGVCAFCSRDATTFDHFIPLSRGGLDRLGNLVPACRSCNCSKSDSDPFVWFAQREHFASKRLTRIAQVTGISVRRAGARSL